MLQTSENGPLGINMNMECPAKQVRYPPPSARSISNRLHMRLWLPPLLLAPGQQGGGKGMDLR